MKATPTTSAGSNNGTIQGGVTFAAGEVGQAFSFNGTNAYIQAPDTGLPLGSSPRTLAFWMKPQLNARVPVIYGGFAANNAFYVLVSGSHAAIGQWGGGDVSGSANVADGNWHYIAMTYDGASSVNLYVDGVLDATATKTYNTTSTGKVILGSDVGGSNEYYNGLLDEVMIYNRALTNSEIQNVMSSGTPAAAVGYTQTGGTTTILTGGALTATSSVVKTNNSATVAIDGGTLTGSGTINGNVTNAGQVSPGGVGTAGVLTINGNYTQTAAGTLAVDIAGGNAGQYDQHNVSGAVALGGTINVNRPGNYVPPSQAVFQIISFASVSGDFATRNGFSAGGGQVFDEQFTASNLDLVTNFAQLSFQGQPSNVTAGQTFAPLQVAILDANNNVVTGDNSDTVTLTVNKGTLLGTLSEPVVNGIATFPDLSITRADTGYQLTASVTAIPSVVSTLFNVSPSNPTQLGFLTAPGNIVFGSPFNPAVEVATEDKYGNVESGDNSSQVTLSLSTDPTGAALTGATNPATVSGGIATFTGLTVSKGGTGYQLQRRFPGCRLCRRPPSSCPPSGPPPSRPRT